MYDEWIDGQTMKTYKANHVPSTSCISPVSIHVNMFLTTYLCLSLDLVSQDRPLFSKKRV